MPHYSCLRCNYKTDHKTSMYYHFSKPVKCAMDVTALKYNENEIVKYSLCQTINHDKLFKNNVNYNTCKNTEEFINEMKTIYKDKRRKCNYCNAEFSKYKDLENHLFDCIEINSNKTDSSANTTNNSTINNNTVNNNPIIYNNCNIGSINNINNINNININIEFPKKDLVSFNDDWNIEHLDNNTKILLFLSTVKYTKTLEYILGNDTNKNVLIDADSKTGLIYTGDQDKFEKINIEDIIDKSMSKLYKHLKDFHQEIKDTNDINFQIDTEVIKHFSRTTKEKFDNYKKNEEIRKNVTDVITSIFNKYKGCTKDKYMEISAELNDNIYLY